MIVPWPYLVAYLGTFSLALWAYLRYLHKPINAYFDRREEKQALRRLREKTEMHELIQPRFKHLREMLLTLGGVEVVPRYEPDLSTLLAHGRVWDYEIRRFPMRPCKCHENSARLVGLVPEKLTMVTGWALDPEDGLWRQHSWVFDRKTCCILETTWEFEIYFGIIVQEKGAEE